MSEVTDKKIHWLATFGVLGLVCLIISLPIDITRLKNKFREVNHTLSKQNEANADLQRQIDDLKCELEEMKKQTESQPEGCEERHRETFTEPVA